jgi:hypothetical protein
MIKIVFLTTALIGVVYLFTILDTYLSLLIASSLLLLYVAAYSIIINKKNSKLFSSDNDGDLADHAPDKTCAQRSSTMNRTNAFLTIKEYDDICNMEISGQSRVKKLKKEVDAFKQSIAKQEMNKLKK